MKKFLSLLFVGIFLLFTGCVSESQNTVVTPTPQIIYVTVLVTPSPATVLPSSSDAIEVKTQSTDPEVKISIDSTHIVDMNGQVADIKGRIINNKNLAVTLGLDSACCSFDDRGARISCVPLGNGFPIPAHGGVYLFRSPVPTGRDYDNAHVLCSISAFDVG